MVQAVWSLALSERQYRDFWRGKASSQLQYAKSWFLFSLKYILFQLHFLWVILSFAVSIEALKLMRGCGADYDDMGCGLLLFLHAVYLQPCSLPLLSFSHDSVDAKAPWLECGAVVHFHAPSVFYCIMKSSSCLRNLWIISSFGECDWSIIAWKCIELVYDFSIFSSIAKKLNLTVV